MADEVAGYQYIPGSLALHGSILSPRPTTIAICGVGRAVRNQYLPFFTSRLFGAKESPMFLKHSWKKWAASTGLFLTSTCWDMAKFGLANTRKDFPQVECKWGDEGLQEIIKDKSIDGVLVVLAAQGQTFQQLFEVHGHWPNNPCYDFELSIFNALEQAEYAWSVYNLYCTRYQNVPIWALAEYIRFEPAFLEEEFTILDMGVQFIAGLRTIVGCEVASVSAITSFVNSIVAGPSVINSSLQLENKCRGVFELVACSNFPKVIWRFVGEKGTLEIQHEMMARNLGYSVTINVDGEIQNIFYPCAGVTGGLKTILSDIQMANLKRPDPRLTYVEGVRDIAVMKAMQESGRTKSAFVPVKEF